MDCPCLTVRNLSKTFVLYARSRDRIKELFVRKPCHRVFTALENISFTLSPSSVLGIVGENGSGKSTLLKLIAGVLIPDCGTIESFGKITGLLELGTGFSPELSGRDNIAINSTYLHMSRDSIAKNEASIIAFAQLEDCIDAPLKTYSSGQAMRLAYSIAIHANPKCLLIDEALSVGDVGFQQKCFAHLKSFKKQGGSILFVSHDMNAVKLLADEVLVLDHGKCTYLGEPEEAINIYNAQNASHTVTAGTKTSGYGNGAVHINAVWLTDRNGTQKTLFTSGEPLSIHFSYICNEAVEHVTFGFMIRDHFGQDVFGTNGALLSKLHDIHTDGAGCFHIQNINLGKGVYSINMAAHQGTTHLQTCYHWWDNATSFEVLEDTFYRFSGHTRLATTLTFTK